MVENKLSELASDILENLDGFKDGVIWFIIITFIWPILKMLRNIIRIHFSKIILGTVRDISVKEQRHSSFFMLLSSYRFFLPLAIWWITICLFGGFIICFELTFENDISIMGIILLSLIILSAMLRIRLGEITFNTGQTIVILVLFNIYAFLMLIRYGVNVDDVNCWRNVVFAVLAILTITNYVGINQFYIKKIWLVKERYKRWLKLIKEVCLVSILLYLLAYMLQYTIHSLEIVMVVYFVIWMVLCIMEWILETVDTSSAVPMEVVLWSEVVLTKKRIVQYKPNKIKVICENGSTKLIDNKEIKYIKYYLKNYDAEMKVYKVLCISYSAPREEYHGYKYFSDDWVTFHRIREGLCEVVLVPDRTVKEIIVDKVL